MVRRADNRYGFFLGSLPVRNPPDAHREHIMKVPVHPPRPIPLDLLAPARNVPASVSLSGSQPLTHNKAQPPGTATRLVEAAGERKLSLSRYSDGTVEVTLSAPAATRLVLSGGGAKGIAYPGVVQALEESGALRSIQVISGSSAGGISAALIASGMDAKAFDTLSDSINLPDLLNSKNPVLEWVQKANSSLGKVAGRVPGQAGNLSQLLFTLLPRLQSKAEPLEEMLRNESRKSILTHIANLPRDTRPAALMAIADKLSAGGATTFADLHLLSQHLPAIKQLNITGTGMFDGRPQLVVFNASLTPDMDIARAAHISGSLPVVFSQPVEQGLAFQERAGKTAFQDGGLLLNIPDNDLYERTFPDSPLSMTEKLIIKFEPAKSPVQPARGGIGSSLVDAFTGVAHTAAHQFQTTRIKALDDQTVILPLNTDKGDFRGKLNGTINFTMPLDVKNHLQALSRHVVNEHLERRAAVREQHHFASLDEAVLAMDDEMFNNAKPLLERDPASRDVLRFRQSAGQALQALDTLLAEASEAPVLTLTPSLGAALRNLDALASRPEHIEWLGMKLNAADNRNYQQLLQAMSTDATQGLSKVITRAVAEMKKRDIAVIADNLTREVIYPSLFRPGQPDANVNLLRRAEHSLARATTASEVNHVLDDIIEHYVARNKPWTQHLHSTTVEMARAWRIPT